MWHFNRAEYLLGFRLIKGLVQSVAVWQYCLRLSNVQSCCATLEYRLRNICSNEFGIYSQPIFQTFGFSAHSLCLHCSNLRQPFEPLLLFDSLARYCTSDCLLAVAFFCANKGLCMLVAQTRLLRQFIISEYFSAG